MKTQRLGTSELEVTRLAYGCMRLAWQPPNVSAEAIEKGIRALEAAVEAGYTFFDHADIYGRGACESIFGEALRRHPGWRDRLIIATKCGIRRPDDPHPGAPHRYDFSFEHIVGSVEGSLQRLGVETIDLLMLHRPDFLADPEEIARAFTRLHEAGKVRTFGVSNFRPSLVAAVQSALPFPLQVNQVEIHPRRLDAFTDGTLDQCLERRLTPMAWSPLDRGRLAPGQPSDPALSADPHWLQLTATLDTLAAAYGIDRATLVLAWLLRHPAKIIPVIGSTDPGRIAAAARATETALDRETWYEILHAARGEPLP
ncbi:MAG TPA: aldo/keto reductase [Chthoniobacteraceae bacterium]|nr:aldo/keto reductase [Chthoniobacteraceae bacterium]